MGTTYRQRPLGGKEQATPAPPLAPSVSIGPFMDRLEKQGVTFDLVGDELGVEVPLGVLSDEQRHELTARRAEIEYLVRLALTASAPTEERVVADDRHAQMPLGQVA